MQTIRPTNASSAGFVYNYSVPKDVDIVKQVVESCAAYGIKVGVYYSINRNAYLGVWDPGRVQAGAKVTQAQWVRCNMNNWCC